MNLSNSFSLEQLVFSETAVRRDLDNTPNSEQIQNLTELAQVLERVQEFLGHPITVISAYRSLKVNTAVGGSPTSDHMEGLAGDIVCPAFGTPIEVCEAVKRSRIPFDQTIYEYKKWCHLGIGHRLRSETFTKNYGEPYIEGFVA